VPKRPQKSAAANLGRQARALRAKGYSYALIEKQLGIPYLQARELAAEYDAKHGKPQRVIRNAPTVVGPNVTSVPVRDLRNNTAALLRQVEKGHRFIITVSGRTVAELGPISSRLVFAPRSVIEAIIREAPLDKDFTRDVDEGLDQSVDEF
jgi:prevent-host-death family protein